MLSVLNLMILRLGVDSVEDFADFGSAGANPADYSTSFFEKITAAVLRRDIAVGTPSWSTPLPSLATQELSSLETQQMFSLETQEVSSLATQEMSCFEMFCFETQEMSTLETQEMSCLETQEMSCLETQEEMGHRDGTHLWVTSMAPKIITF